MAYDPERGEVHDAPNGEVAEGHYANMAGRIDEIFTAAQLSAVALHQQAYSRAAGELNSMSPSERTPLLQARVDRLAREASEAASEANLELIMERAA